MPNPERLVDVRTPLLFCWLESLKMFSTSIWRPSDACAAIEKLGPSFSPGSLTALRSDRSAPVPPPSTLTGPWIAESRWVVAG